MKKKSTIWGSMQLTEQRHHRHETWDKTSFILGIGKIVTAPLYWMEEVTRTGPYDVTEKREQQQLSSLWISLIQSSFSSSWLLTVNDTEDLRISKLPHLYSLPFELSGHYNVDTISINQFQESFNTRKNEIKATAEVIKKIKRAGPPARRAGKHFINTANSIESHTQITVFF